MEDLNEAWGEVVKAVQLGLIPDTVDRVCRWDATDYLIAADFLEEHGYYLASKYMARMGRMRVKKP